MVQLFQNIWSWINSNWPEIAGVLGAIDLTAAAAALTMLIKHKRNFSLVFSFFCGNYRLVAQMQTIKRT
jgi:hypothetical protein